MKKSVLLCFLALLSLSFFSCGDSWNKHDFVIANLSRRDVSFSIDNYGAIVYTLAPNQFFSFNLYDHPAFTFQNHPRVYFETGFDAACFRDMKAYSFKISSQCSKNVVLSEQNGMLTDVYGGTETIPANGEKNVVAYVESPSFSAYYLNDRGEKVNAMPFLSWSKN